MKGYVDVTEDDVEINNNDLRDSKLSYMLYELIKDYNMVQKLINNVAMTDEIKDALFLNFTTTVKPRLLSLPNTVSYSELLKYILSMAYQILLPENEFKNSQAQLKRNIIPTPPPSANPLPIE